MKITLKEPEIERANFGDLAPGIVFKYDIESSVIYLVLDESSRIAYEYSDGAAVNLKTGEITFFDNNEKVYPMTAELIAEFGVEK